MSWLKIGLLRRFGVPRGWSAKDTLSDTLATAALVAAARQAAWAREAGEGGESALTLREWQVLQLVARGLTNQAIADALGISERTVRDHLTHIYARLGVLGRGQAIAWAVRRALARH